MYYCKYYKIYFFLLLLLLLRCRAKRNVYRFYCGVCVCVLYLFIFFFRRCRKKVYDKYRFIRFLRTQTVFFNDLVISYRRIALIIQPIRILAVDKKKKSKQTKFKLYFNRHFTIATRTIRNVTYVSWLIISLHSLCFIQLVIATWIFSLTFSHLKNIIV